MKKVILFFAVATLASCGGVGSSESTTTDSTAVVDSTVVADTTVISDTVPALGGGSPVLEITPVDGSETVKKEAIK